MVLASYIRPFDAKQQIYVLNGKKDTEEIRLCDLDHFADTVMQLAQEYEVSEVELHGNVDLCKNTKKQINLAEKTKYNKNTIKVIIKGV